MAVAYRIISFANFWQQPKHKKCLHNISICKSSAGKLNISYVQASAEVQSAHSIFNFSS